jgi:hypothetical protein
MKYTGRSTSKTSPTPYKYEIHVCFFNGFASSGQLFTEVTVVCQVFDFAFVLGKLGGHISSSIVDRIVRFRNGFHLAIGPTIMLTVALRHAIQSQNFV